MQLSPHHAQRGSFLLEALVATIIFVMGVLGLVALQGAGIAANTDIRYRVEAARMADRMMSEIQGRVQRDAKGNITTDLSEFDHHATGNQCTATEQFTGDASEREEVVAWDTDLRPAPATPAIPAVPGEGGEPGTPAVPANPGGPTRTSLPNPNNKDWYQIRVTSGTTNQVRITICWQQPGLEVPRKHILIGAIS